MSEQGMKKINQSVGKLLDFPKEFTLDLPKVVLLGDFQLYIENHQGINRYGAEEVVINCSLGLLVVRGEDLMIRQISIDELYLEGRIQSLSYNRPLRREEGMGQ